MSNPFYPSWENAARSENASQGAARNHSRESEDPGHPDQGGTKDASIPEQSEAGWTGLQSEWPSGMANVPYEGAFEDSNMTTFYNPSTSYVPGSDHSTLPQHRYTLDNANMGWLGQDINTPISPIDHLQTGQDFTLEYPPLMNDNLFNNLSTSFPLKDDSNLSPNVYQQMTPESLQSPSAFAPEPTSQIFPSGPSDQMIQNDDDEVRWKAILSRSHSANSSFLFGVVTTKIYCKPSCAARHPSRQNVRYFPFPGAIEAASSAGLRPCKRCRPELSQEIEPGVKGVISVLQCIVVEATDIFGPGENKEKEDMRLESLASTAGLSPFHFHRVFKSITLLTPGDVIAACRALALGDCVGMDRAYSAHSACPNMKTKATLSASPQDLLAESKKWKPRSARKALGGISPNDYASGCTNHVVQATTITTLYHGTSCIAYIRSTPKNTNTTNSPSGSGGSSAINVLAVLTTPPTSPNPLVVESRLRIRFPAMTLVNDESISRRVLALEDEKSEREHEIPPRLSEWVWRGRVWISLVKG